MMTIKKKSQRSLFDNNNSPQSICVRASSERRRQLFDFRNVQAEDKNKFSFSAHQLQMAIEKEANRASALVRVNVGDALKYYDEKVRFHRLPRI